LAIINLPTDFSKIIYTFSFLGHSGKWGKSNNMEGIKLSINGDKINLALAG
jgi:hypothetical protein